MSLDDGRVVSNFIVQALRNEPITIYGDGLQTRSFCYVEDLIRGIISLFFNEDYERGPVNLGNPDEFTMLELAKLVLEATNSNSKLIYSELPSDDPRQRKPDISKANKILNWNPSINLRDGLRLTIEEFQSRVK
jgi:UDP-glucuronate decarboxylase